MPMSIFISYADQDEQLCIELWKHLQPLQREGLAHTWYKCNVVAGNVQQQEIDKYLQSADIILLLVSPDFMSSDYLFSEEMQQALLRHTQGNGRVLPVILRPTDWQIAPLRSLKPLPLNAKPVALWRNRDEAFVHIVDGIRSVLTEKSSLMKSSSPNAFPNSAVEDYISGSQYTRLLANIAEKPDVSMPSSLALDTKEIQQSVVSDRSSIVEDSSQLLEDSTGSQTISATNKSSVKNVKQTIRSARKKS